MAWCREAFAAQGLSVDLAQCNLSHNTRRGTLRGMHFQVVPHAEAKMVRCVSGAVHDVALDLRPESPTYKQSFATELSATNGRALFMPEGIAHGFQTLADDSTLFYQMSTAYEAEAATGVRWNDPAFQIDWPLTDPIVNDRDQFPRLRIMSVPSQPNNWKRFNVTASWWCAASYEAAEIEPIQRGIHAIIGLVIEEQGLTIEQPPFAPENFDGGFQELIAHDRALGARVYDAVKQIPAFIRLVASTKHEAVVRQVRATDQPAVVAGGYGIRIDNPQEEKFRAGWHQDYPAQIRSLDGLVFWSPLVAMTPELGPVEFCVGSHRDGLAPVQEMDEANPDKTGAYGLTLVDEEARVANYKRRRR